MTNPKNRIASALYERLKKAIENKESFRTVIFIPIHPGSQLGGPSGAVSRGIVGWEHASIFRSPKSLLAKLKADYPKENIDQYIQFFSLRTYGPRPFDPSKSQKGNYPKTEQIYIHAKFLSIDDRIAIVSSANINDRSMIGNRDSELGAVIRDNEMITIKMGGKDFEVSKIVHEFRTHLMRHHTGIEKDSEEAKAVEDPIAFFDTLSSIAKKNSQIYNEVFPIIPEKLFTDDSCSLLSQFGQSNDRKATNLEKLSQIKGNVIITPFSFLQDSFSSIAKGILPQINKMMI